MAVRERAKGGAGQHSFTSRIPDKDFTDLNEWAWENRLTLSAAVSELLQKALVAERGGEYRRRTDIMKAAAE